MTEVFLKNRKLNNRKLRSFGFVEKEKEFFYEAEIADGQMKMTVVVNGDGRLFTEITDVASGEEYVLHRVPDATGGFVGRVKAQYDALLKEIAENCSDVEVFKYRQSKMLIEYVRENYGDELEYLWVKFPDNAVWRRKDNKKWYAALLTVSRRKLGLDPDESVEILDLRIKPEDMQKTVDNVNYFPGYHMNKKHWFTVCLDGTVEFEEICEKLRASYALAK